MFSFERKLVPAADPRRFRLGMALPHRSVELNARYDFFRGKSDSVREEIIGVLAELTRLARQVLGDHAVHTIECVDDFGSLFEDGVEVVTLFAHSPGRGRVELLGSVVPWHALAEVIPRNTHAIIDLVGCEGEVLADEVRRWPKPPAVYAWSGAAELQSVAFYYAQTLRIVCREHIPYADASKRAWAECLQIGRNESQ